MLEFKLENSIKVARAKQGITQAELAIKVGVSRKTINTIETGKFVPSVITAFRISNALNLSIDEVFALKERSD